MGCVFSSPPLEEGTVHLGRVHLVLPPTHECQKEISVRAATSRELLVPPVSVGSSRNATEQESRVTPHTTTDV